MPFIHSRAFSEILFKMGGAAAAVGLLACVAFSSPANAATFTLAELAAGQDLFAGNLRFFDFSVPESGGDNPLNLITVTTIDSDLVPGFAVNGNGLFFQEGDPTFNKPEFLNIEYKVETIGVGPHFIGGALLWANDYSIENGTALHLRLLQQPGPAVGLVDLDVLIAEPFGLPVTNLDLPADSIHFLELQSALALRSEMDMRIVVEEALSGPAVLNSYSMLFPVVVPEPGTALLMGLGLVGMGVVGRSRREESEGTA